MEIIFALVSFIVGIVIGIKIAFYIQARLKPKEADFSSFEKKEAVLNERIDNLTAQNQIATLLVEKKEKEITELNRALSEFKSQVAVLTAELENQKAAFDSRFEDFKKLETNMRDTFIALATGALKENNLSFLELAKENLQKFQVESKGELEQKKQSFEALVKPIQEALQNISKTTSEIEKERKEAWGGLRQLVGSLAVSQEKLHTETANLVTALRKPQVRGLWGEMQLKNVVELAGMKQHCDFFEQVSLNTKDGRIRPDMLVRLPNNRSIIIDAKAPLMGYLEALEADTEEKKAIALKSHTRHIKDHINKLAEKNYWAQFEDTLDFVVLFIPGESFFSAALEGDPSLIEIGINKGVVVATPTTLIALLKAVAYGWNQESLAENYKTISELGQALYDRLSTMTDHFSKVGKSLGASVDSYNKTIGSLEGMVLPKARQFKELGISSKKELSQTQYIETNPREPRLLSDNE